MRFSERLMYLLCDPVHVEELVGDIAELARRRATRWGRVRTRIRHGLDVLSVCVRQSRFHGADGRVGAGLAAGALVLAAAWSAGTWAGPGSFSVDATDPAGRFTLEIEHGRVTAATIDGAAVPAERLRQAGRRLLILGGDGDRDFTIRLTRGGIRWEARRARGSPVGPECRSDESAS